MDSPENSIGSDKVVVGFPPQIYPGIEFPVHLIGIDQNSFGYFHIASKKYWKKYREFLRTLKAEYNSKRELIPFDEIQIGMFVIARVKREGLASNYFVRAEVLTKCNSSRKLCCLNMDEFEEFESIPEDIFFPSEESYTLAKQAIKFELAGLSNFLYTNLAQKALEQMPDMGGNFEGELVGQYNHPILRLTMSNGQDFTQQILKKLFQMLGPNCDYFFDE